MKVSRSSVGAGWGLFARTLIPKGENLGAPYIGESMHYAQAIGLIKKGLGTHLFGHRSTGIDIIIDGRHAATKAAATLKRSSPLKRGRPEPEPAKKRVEEPEPAKKRQATAQRHDAEQAHGLPWGCPGFAHETHCTCHDCDDCSRLFEERYAESQARGLAWVCTQEDARQRVRDWIFNIGDITTATKYSNRCSLQGNLLLDGFSLSEQEIASFFQEIQFAIAIEKMWSEIEEKDGEGWECMNGCGFIGPLEGRSRGMRRCHEARCSHRMPPAESRLKKSLIRLTVLLEEPVRTSSLHHDGKQAVGSGRRGCQCHSASLQYVYIQSCDLNLAITTSGNKLQYKLTILSSSR